MNGKQELTTLEGEQCGTCRFFDPDDASGFCVRFPPVVVNSQLHCHEEYDYIAGPFGAVWPRVQEDNWCGEYQPKKPAAAG